MLIYLIRGSIVCQIFKTKKLEGEDFEGIFLQYFQTNFLTFFIAFFRLKIFVIFPSSSNRFEKKLFSYKNWEKFVSKHKTIASPRATTCLAHVFIAVVNGDRS